MPRHSDHIEEKIDTLAEDSYWRQNFRNRPYVGETSYEDFGPAYRYGVDAFVQYPDRSFAQLEGDLSREWPSVRGDSQLSWERAKSAVRDAWQRLSDGIERAMPGDSDRDGK